LNRIPNLCSKFRLLPGDIKAHWPLVPFRAAFPVPPSLNSCHGEVFKVVRVVSFATRREGPEINVSREQWSKTRHQLAIKTS
jgi:hypothetical protein